MNYKSGSFSEPVSSVFITDLKEFKKKVQLFMIYYLTVFENTLFSLGTKCS
jgi:hypothetical protein